MHEAGVNDHLKKLCHIDQRQWSSLLYARSIKTYAGSSPSPKEHAC